MKPQSIEKTLSKNDIGETGGHQAGILVPKRGGVLPFFPRLDEKRKNPRTRLKVIDDTGREWSFSFIYYNNRFFGGTRNEYRLTGMTKFFRAFNLKPGDRVIFNRESDGALRITFKRARKQEKTIKLSLTWKIISSVP